MSSTVRHYLGLLSVTYDQLMYTTRIVIQNPLALAVSLTTPPTVETKLIRKQYHEPRRM